MCAQPAHLPVLTPLRGIAALLVVLFHFTSPKLMPSLDTSAHTMLIANGYLAVDLFFLMSGTVIAHVYGSRLGKRFSLVAAANFMKARFARVYPLHFCTLAYLVLVSLILSPLVGALNGLEVSLPREGRYSIDAAVANLLLIHGLWNEQLTWNAPSWSISTEFFAYLAFPVLALVFARLGRNGTIVGIAGLYGGLALLAYNQGSLEIVTGPSFLRCLLQFAIGTLLYRLYCDGMFRGVLSRDGIFTAVALATIATMHFDGLDILVVACFALLILAGINNRGRVARWMQTPALAWLGTVSYSVYLTHGVVDEMARVLLLGATGVPDGRNLGLWPSLAIAAVMLAFVLLLSDLTYRRIEVPARAWLKSLTVRSVWVRAQGD